MIQTKKAAIAATGGLGNPSKMPGLAYGLSAFECQTGSKLRSVPGSVCADCYACGANYIYPTVATAHERRMETVRKLHIPAERAQWVSAMVYLISREMARIDQTHFRWHDSGDLQSASHLAAIIEVARETPHLRHWLPTKEASMVARYITESPEPNPIPRNLALRVSAPMVDQAPRLNRFAHVTNRAGTPVVGGSAVHHNRTAGELGASPCRAYEGKTHECGRCRKCWDTVTYPVISYPKH